MPQATAPPDPKPVSVEIIALDADRTNPDRGHLRHDSASRPNSFGVVASATSRGPARGQGLRPGTAGGRSDSEPRLVEVLLTLAPWADGSLLAVRSSVPPHI